MVVTYSIARGGQWQLPWVGAPAVTGSNGVNNGVDYGYGVLVNITGGTGMRLIPSGELGVQMMLVAQYRDGTNSTLTSRSSGNLPSFAVVQMSGEPIAAVVDYAVLGVSAPYGNPLPEGSTAKFKINFTAYNEQSNYMKWHYSELTTPFISGGTLAIIRAPALTVLPWEAFGDVCSKSNGVWSCQSNGFRNHRIDWIIHSTVIITTPTYGQFAVVSGSSVSTADVTGSISADFGVDGSVTGCGACGGANAVSIGTANNGEPQFRVIGSSVSGCSAVFLPIFCITGVVQGTSNGADSSGVGADNIGKSLLPPNYIPFTNVPFGRTLILNTRFLFVAIFSYIIVMAAVLLFVIRRK